MMTNKEKKIQRALGVLPTFGVKIKVDLDGMDRKDALGESRKILKLLRKHFPNYKFKKGLMKSTNY